jgi:hypothetical protein
MAYGARETRRLVDSLKSIDAIARALRPLGPPVIVFNKSHSGSRVLTRALAACGVFMGSRLNVSEDALDIQPLVEHLIEFHYPDYQRLFSEGDPQLFAALVPAIEAHLKDRPPGMRWGWKLSETGYALPLFARLFPDAWFIHLVRDGRDVAFSHFRAPTDAILRKAHFGSAGTTSYRGVPASEIGYEAAPHVFNARLWVESVTAARAYGAMLGPRYLETRYETLTGDFTAEIGRIARWAQLTPTAEALGAVARSIQTDKVGKHRSAPPAALVEALSVLEPTLSAFGYGEGMTQAAAPAPWLSLLLTPAPAGQSALGREAYVQGIKPFPPGMVEVVAMDGEPGEAERTAVHRALSKARGRYVLFIRPGQRLRVQAIRQLLAALEREGARAAFARAVDGGGRSSNLPTQAEDLRWADSVPLGTAVFDRAAILAAMAQTTGQPNWHWGLARHAALSLPTLISSLQIVEGKDLAPTIITDAPLSGPLATHRTDEPRIIVCGAPEASLSLLFDGLPDGLKRHIRLLPPFVLPGLMRELMSASAVIFLREFEQPVKSGAVAALRTLGIPYWYMTDDHFPTLAAEEPNLAFHTEEACQAFLAGAAGAIAATRALADAVAVNADNTLLWPHVFDPSLLPAPEAAGPRPPFRRIGMMGGLFRGEALVRDVMPALAGLAAERPVTLAVRQGGLWRTAPHMALIEMPFEAAFRQFVFRWRGLGLDTVIHPRAATRNATYKSPSALLASLYLGAVPIVADDAAYAGITAGDGVLVAPGGPASWRAALDEAGDPERHAKLHAALRAYCEQAFSPAPAIAALTEVLRRAPVPDAGEIARRISWLQSKSGPAGVS